MSFTVYPKWGNFLYRALSDFTAQGMSFPHVFSGNPLLFILLWMPDYPEGMPSAKHSRGGGLDMTEYSNFFVDLESVR